MELRKNNTVHLLLFLVLAGAFAIRFKGIWFGFPLSLHPDEPKLVESALRIILTGDLNPHFFNYPSLNIYLQALVYRVSIFTIQLFSNIATIDMPKIWFYLIGRSFNVLLSVLTILVTYKIGRYLVSPIMGIASACFIGASFLHIDNSYMATVDSSVALWTSLACLMAVLMYTNGKKNWYYWLGGIFVGLAIGSKYTAFISAAPILIAHYKVSREKKDWIDKNIIAALIVIPLVFIATTPYAILDHKAFWNALRYEAHHYSLGHPGNESAGTTTFSLYLKYLMVQGYGFLPILFSCLGMLWLLKKDFWKGALLLSTPIFLFLFVGRYKVFFPRNIIAAIPFLSLFSGYFIFSVYEWLEQRLSYRKNAQSTILSIHILVFATIIGSIYPNVHNALTRIHRITLPDTRWVSIQWIKENIPAGSHIGREHYTPPIEEYTDQYQVSPLGYFAVARRPIDVKKQDYMIVSSGDYERFLKSPDKYPNEVRSYIEFFRNHELVHEFLPDDDKLGGPKISIYKIGRRFNNKLSILAPNLDILCQPHQAQVSHGRTKDKAKKLLLCRRACQGNTYALITI